MAIAPSPISVLKNTDGTTSVAVRVCIDLLQEIDDLAVLVARAPRRGFVFRGAGGQIRGGRAGARAGRGGPARMRTRTVRAGAFHRMQHRRLPLIVACIRYSQNTYKALQPIQDRSGTPLYERYG